MARGFGKQRYQIFLKSPFEGKQGGVSSKKFGSKSKPTSKQKALWKSQGKIFKVVDMWGGWK
jgi:hypothetical protein